MNLTRREVTINALKLSALACVSGFAVGCTASTVEDDINIVLQQVDNVLSFLAPNSSWTTDLQNAITALKTAEAAWINGSSPSQIVIDALNAIVNITAVIPLTEPFAPLIAVLVAGIEIVINLLVPANPANTVVRVRLITPNPYIGRVKITHHIWHNQVGDFKANWNDACAKNPALASAVLK